ncbi:MAG TPA: glycosyltransferase family 39 protein [Terriglobales bacterium]|nr:glycosyltransferase family 39 protein [Terriglobales bacterium]
MSLDAAEAKYSPQAAVPARAIPGSSTRQRLFRSPAFIVVVALLLRMLVITAGHTYRITPRRDHFQFGWEMGRIARSLATGHGFASPTDLPTGPSAWEAPLYPFLLAGVFKLFGVYTLASGWMILALNSLFSALTCLVIYRIGDRLFGTTPARWAAWTWALFPYAIYWPVRVVWETSLSALLLSLVVLLCLRLEKTPRRGDWVLLGVLWGVIALTNPTLLSLLPFSLAWLGWKLRGRSQALLAGMLLTAAIACLLVAPWLVRNYRVFGQFVFIRDNFGLELHMANNPQSAGRWTRSEHPGNDPDAMRKFAEMGELPYMKAEQRAAFDFIRTHPGEFLAFCAQRALYFWVGNPQETLAGSWTLAPARHLAFLISALAAFAGLWLCFRNRVPGTFLLACCLFIYPLPYYLAHPSPRYRHAIEPEMLLLIIYALWLYRDRQVRWPKLRHNE